MCGVLISTSFLQLLADTLRQHESELYLRQKVEMNIVQAHEMAEKLSKEW